MNKFFSIKKSDPKKEELTKTQKWFKKLPTAAKAFIYVLLTMIFLIGLWLLALIVLVAISILGSIGII